MINANVEAQLPASEKRLKGWHVLLIMLGFFGVIFAVNGVFLYHAITSFPGEDVKKSYVQGLNYNDTLAARAAQAELGWSAEAGLRDDVLVFRLHDADGAPVLGKVVVGDLRRVATRESDRELVLRANGRGEYVSEALQLNPGQWSLNVKVYDASGESIVFNVDKTLLVS